MRLTKAVPAIILTLAATLISGCILVPGLRVSASGDHPNAAVPYRVIEVTPQLVAQQKLTASTQTATWSGLQPADPAKPPSEYKIGPGDVLQIVIWDHLELTNPFGAVTRDPVSGGQLVAADGTLFFPYAGVLQVGGKTVQQVRNMLIDGLRSVITRPQVDVRIAAFRADRVQVTGEVKNPGVVTIDDTVKGVLEAINERGGLSETASRRTALLIRNGQSYPIDMGGLLSGDRPALNPRIRPGDIVHVPDTSEDQVFVLGEVSKQGPVVLSQQQTTLIEALTKTGGLDKTTANDSGVLVFRKPAAADQAAQIFALNLANPAGLLLAGEFVLAPRDVVYVKATKFAQYNLIINQLLPTITTIYQVDRLTQ